MNRCLRAMGYLAAAAIANVVSATSPPEADVLLFNASTQRISVHKRVQGEDSAIAIEAGESAKFSQGYYAIHSANAQWLYRFVSLGRNSTASWVVPLQFNEDGIVQRIPSGKEPPIAKIDTPPWGYIQPDSPRLEPHILEPYLVETRRMMRKEDEVIRTEVAARFEQYRAAVEAGDIDAVGRVRKLETAQRAALQTAFEFCDVVSVESQAIGVEGSRIWVDFLRVVKVGHSRCHGGSESEGGAAMFGREGVYAPWMIEAVIPWGDEAEERNDQSLD